MAKNYMPEVAKMLGVELDERFKLSDGTGFDFTINENGLLVINGNQETYSEFVLEKVLKGEFEIIKLPWRPQECEKYYYVTPSGKIDHWLFDGGCADLALFYMGNYFRTREDAIAHKNEIINKYEEVMT